MSKLFDLISKNSHTLLVAVCLLICAPFTYAADPVEKILIIADHMQMNIDSGRSVYTGNVKISQGELVLTGNKVVLETLDQDLENMTVTGKPARYNHLTKEGESIKAQSEVMVYTASQNKLVMTINAHLVQPDHKLSSQRIVYDTEKRVVIAGNNNKSPKTKNERVKITLTPQKPQTDKTQPNQSKSKQLTPGK